MLIGTASTWFLLDIAFYSQNLFLPNILEGIGYNPKINLPASKCVKTKTCPHYNLPVSPPHPFPGRSLHQPETCRAPMLPSELTKLSVIGCSHLWTSVRPCYRSQRLIGTSP